MKDEIHCDVGVYIGEGRWLEKYFHFLLL
jgi:hypothetical protein